MPLGIVARSTANTNNTAATTSTFSPSANFSAGSWAVLAISADNSASAGSTNNINNVTDSLGNTWTPRHAAIFDNGAASAGVQGSIWTTDQNVATLATSTVITITFGVSTTSDTRVLFEVTRAAGETIEFVTAGGGANTSTTTPSITTSTVAVGDLAICAIFGEAGTTQTPTADADTTNGTWAATTYAEIGSTTSGNVISAAGKIQTTTASTQTYNPTFGLAMDATGAYVVLHEAYYGTFTADAYIQAVVTGTFTADTYFKRLGGDAYERVVLADNPIGYWRLNDASVGGTENGTPILDATGNHDAIWSNIYSSTGYPIFQSPGFVADGLSVTNNDGDWQFVDVTNHADFQTGDTFSIEMWFQRAAGGRPGGGNEFLWNKGNVSGSANILIRAAGSLDFDCWGYGNIVSGPNIAGDVKPHHLVVTKNGTANAKMYLDGVEVGSPWNDKTVANTSANIHIGADADSGWNWFVGRMGEVAFYDYPLTSTQASTHYAAASKSAHSFTADAALAVLLTREFSSAGTTGLDTFTEAGTGTADLTTHTPEQGTWSLFYSSSSATVLIDKDNDFAVHSAAAQTESSTVAYQLTTLGDGEVVVTSVIDADRYYGGPAVRMTGTDNFYSVYSWNNSVAQQGAYLKRFSSGIGTNIGWIDGTGWTDLANLRVKIRVSGSSPTRIQVRAWSVDLPEPDVWGIDVEDNTAGNQTASGGAGIALSSSASASWPAASAVTDVTVTPTGNAGPGLTADAEILGVAIAADYPYIGGGYYGG